MTRRSALAGLLASLAALAGVAGKLAAIALTPAKPLPLPEPIRPVPPLPVADDVAARARDWYAEAARNPIFSGEVGLL